MDTSFTLSYQKKRRTRNGFCVHFHLLFVALQPNMGLIKNAILGPIVIYLLLDFHMIYHVFMKDMNHEVTVQDWPKDIKPEAKKAIIESRKAIIDEVFGLLQGTTKVQEFVDKR